MPEAMPDAGMMWGMGVSGWLVLFILVLVAATFIKYVFFR